MLDDTRRPADTATGAEATGDSLMDVDDATERLARIEAENRQLKETISVLRDELERLSFERDERLQQAVAEANSEILHLRSTIQTLRQSLEDRSSGGSPSPADHAGP